MAGSFADVWARAPSGHAAAAPPSIAMNVRRCMTPHQPVRMAIALENIMPWSAEDMPFAVLRRRCSQSDVAAGHAPAHALGSRSRLPDGAAKSQQGVRN